MPTANYSFSVQDKNESFRQCNEAAYGLLDRLIEKHRSLNFLIAHLPIKMLFMVKPSFKKGRKILGKTSVCSAKDNLIHPYKAIILLDLDFWESNADKREPLLFHELCHLEDIDGQLTLVDHDFAEFYQVIRCYGDWQAEIGQAKKQLETYQLELFEDTLNTEQPSLV